MHIYLIITEVKSVLDMSDASYLISVNSERKTKNKTNQKKLKKINKNMIDQKWKDYWKTVKR